MASWRFDPSLTRGTPIATLAAMLAHSLLLDFDGFRLEGIRPFARLDAKDGALSWQGNVPFRDEAGDPLHALQRALSWARDKFPHGAAIGFLSYDLARSLEPRAFIPASPPDDLSIPDLRLVFCERLTRAPIPSASPEAFDTEPPDESLPDYARGVERIREFIGAGDIYQANLTHRFSAPLPCPPSALYQRLRGAHPMPFGALLEWDDLAVVSNSPERFLSLHDGQLLAQPIKGTIRRGATSHEDEALREELRASAKDRAENVMIVDLLRNDLGRVCVSGSVRVPQLWDVQSFPTLHHLVSTVTGTLRPGLDATDVLRAAFPCGSITGAPKIRAMQIIDELESVRRGVSMGAVGYIGFDCGMEWNVAIRTVTCLGGMAYFHTGGGIVADSRPDSEEAEMRLKARALRRALAFGAG